MLCDQIFRYIEPAESKATCRIPNFLLNQDIPLSRMTILCSNTKAYIEQITDSGFHLITQTGDKDTCQTVCVFIYKDSLQTKLLGVCKIEIQAVALITADVHATVEYEQILKVTNIPKADGSSAQRVVEVFSSDPRTIYAPGGRTRNLQVLKNITKFSQQVPVCIKARMAGVWRNRLNVVDIKGKEII